MITEYVIVAIAFMLGLSFVTYIHYLWLRDAAKDGSEDVQQPEGVSNARNADSNTPEIGRGDWRRVHEMPFRPTARKFQTSGSQL